MGKWMIKNSRLLRKSESKISLTEYLKHGFPRQCNIFHTYSPNYFLQHLGEMWESQSSGLSPPESMQVLKASESLLLDVFLGPGIHKRLWDSREGIHLVEPCGVEKWLHGFSWAAEWSQFIAGFWLLHSWAQTHSDVPTHLSSFISMQPVTSQSHILIISGFLEPEQKPGWKRTCLCLDVTSHLFFPLHCQQLEWL